MNRGEDGEYFGLIGDPLGSLAPEERSPVRTLVRKEIRQLNRRHAGELAGLLQWTRSDEVQGLFRTPVPLVDVMVRVTDAAFPAWVSWGLGKGRVTTDVADDAALLGGPCLLRAREAVREARSTSTWIRVRGMAEPDAMVLEGLLNLMGAIRSEWTPRQAQIVREARTHRQVDIARRLGVHRSTISRALSSAHFTLVMEGEEAAGTLLGTQVHPEKRPALPERMKGR